MRRLLTLLLALLCGSASADWPGYISKGATSGGAGLSAISDARMLANVSGGSAVPTETTFSAWLNKWASSPADGTYGFNVATGAWTLSSAFPSLTGTPANGCFSYWTGTTSQALFCPTSTLQLNQSGAAPTNYAGTSCTNQFPRSLSAAGVATCASVAITDMSMNTARLLGRTTASAGAVEEITAGTGLSLSAGSLAVSGATIAVGGTSGTTVQTATQSLNAPRIIYKRTLPIVYMSSGTMTGSPNGNGAFTGITALTVFAPARALCYMPANSVATSSAAGLYPCTFATTSTGNIIDTTPYTPSDTAYVWPASPTTPTTASTWTGGTGAVTMHSFTLPANSLGARGVLEVIPTSTTATNNANSKSITLACGSLSSASNVISTAHMLYWGKIFNLGSASVNVIGTTAATSVSTLSYTNGTLDTTADATCTFSLSKTTATDNLAIFDAKVIIYSMGD